jgi:NAD(P)-dependent dehydrogenase (short-subunit alcohol dehydrogenase family)
MGMEGWAGVARKRVVITGATNGIGLATAEELARRGARQTIVARDAELSEIQTHACVPVSA